MEVPKPGVELELQLLAYAAATAKLDPSHICRLCSACGNAGSLTHILTDTTLGSFFFTKLPCSFYLFIYFCLFRVAPTAYGNSQARGLIRAAAAGLGQTHSNAGSKPLSVTYTTGPQLTATPDP